jgi:hypothetical protein
MANMAGRGHAAQDSRAPVARAGRGAKGTDLGIVGLGILGFIFSFMPWFGVRYSGFNTAGQAQTWHSNLNAWHSGALAWIPVVLMLIAAGLAAAHLVTHGRMTGIGSVPLATAIAVASIAAVVLIAIRWLTLPRIYGSYLGFPGLSSGARYGLILGLITSILMTLLALNTIRSSSPADAGRPGGADRGPALGGYSGRGTERGRVLDRDREYTGAEYPGGRRQGTGGQDVGPLGGNTADRPAGTGRDAGGRQEGGRAERGMDQPYPDRGTGPGPAGEGDRSDRFPDER